MTATKLLSAAIRHMRPCREAVEWLDTQKFPQKAWNACERGDWQLWILGKLSGPPESGGRKKLVLCACKCARLALKHTKDPRVLACIETAEAWANGKATMEELRKARNAAYAAAYAYAATAYAATAAYAAASAATDAYAGAAAADAAYADAATDAATATATRMSTLKECANIVREFYPKCPKITE